jgi:glycine/D-amino acid oxidase-like deaminating enzyme
MVLTQEDSDNSKGQRFDVAIVGAGIVGLASAYHILAGDPDSKVVIIERALAAGQGDTAKTVAGIRNTFTSEVNRQLSETSIGFYKHVQFDVDFDLHLEFVGYLWLLTPRLLEELEAVIRRMRRDGVALRVLEQDQLSSMIPRGRFTVGSNDTEAKIMGLKSINKGLQGLDCGTLAAEKLVGFYENEVRRMGAVIRYGEQVQSILLEPEHKLGVSGEPFVWQDANVEGVVTSRGEVRAEVVVVAAGGWSTQLLNTVGMDSHVRTKKRQVFALKGPSVSELLYSKGFNDYEVLPMTLIPPRLVYLKPNRAAATFWVGVSDHIGRPFTFEEDPVAEDDFYSYNIYPILSYYFPHFKDVRPFNKWAGHYDLNTIDGNPVIFEDSGLIMAAGASGSGIMKADAIGRVVAAACEKKDIAVLYGGKHFRVARLGIETRDVEHEDFVI